MQRLRAEQAPKRREQRKRKLAPFALTRKLFDAQGEPMSPTHTAGRHGRTYRYYVSASVQQGRTSNRKDGQRVSATALEKVVVNLVRSWVPDAVAPFEFPLRFGLSPDAMRVTLPAHHTRALEERLEPDECTIGRDAETITIEVPIGLPLRGGKRIICASSRAAPRPDRALIAALRKAHVMLESERGRPTLATSPATQYERKILRPAFLAPELQQDILDERQPPTLTLERLKTLTIPIEWNEPLSALGWPTAKP